MTDTIRNAKRPRGLTLAHIIWIQWDIATLDCKDSLGPPDQRKVNRLREQLKEIDRVFEERHLEVLNFIKGYWVSLEAEETIFDEHMNSVSDLLERLEELEQRNHSWIHQL